MTHLDEELRMMRDEARKFTENEVLPEANERDPEGEAMSTELRDKLGEMGFFGITAREEYGGLGMGPLALAVVTEELARGWMSVASIIVRGGGFRGTDEQEERWARDMATGDRLHAVAISEPQAGSDVSNVATTAEKDGDEYILNGEKMWCTFAKGADGIEVLAKTNLEDRRMARFVIDKPPETFDYDGLEGQKLDTIGYHGWHSYHLQLNNVRVPKENLVGGEEGGAFSSTLSGLTMARIHTAARSIGLARGALEDSLEYAQQREQFDQPIGQFQSIRFKLATMATKIEAARQLTHSVAAKASEEPGLRYDREAGMAKYFASEMSEEVTSEGIQIHGGNGYTTDYPLERYWRDARLTKIFEGTSEIQQRIISKRLFEDGVHGGALQ
jgi:butyryl-CoA dehydrogenase/acyl-CoA dehydrogenase